MHKKYSYLKTILAVLAGNTLIAFAVAAFVSTSGIIMGGATGIGLILSHYFPIPLSVSVLIINLILFVLGTVTLGKTFAFATVASTFIYPAALHVFQAIPATQSITSEPMLCAIFGSLLLGLAVGIIIRSGGSTGGTDIIAMVINKYTHANMSAVLYLVDGTVLLIQASFSNTEQVLYGILFLIIQMLVLNKAMLAGRTQIQLMIISDKYDYIRSNLLNVQDVGVTFLQIEKGFTGVASKAILCVTSRKKVHRILDMINEIDDNAFITIHEVNEVHGGGFTKARIKL